MNKHLKKHVIHKLKQIADKGVIEPEMVKGLVLKLIEEIEDDERWAKAEPSNLKEWGHNFLQEMV